MNKKYLYILLISLIPLAFYLMRPDMAGADTYFFVNYVCKGIGSMDVTPPLSTLFFNIIPCNFVLIKIILWLLLLSSSLIVAKTGELFHKNGWLAGIFVFGAPIWIQEFLKFEDDQFAFPILFLAQYFFFKGITRKRKAHQAIAVGLVGLSGLIWKGAILYFIAFGLTYIPALLAGIGLIWFFGLNKFIGAILPTFKVIENYPVIGVAGYYFLLIGFAGVQTIFLPQLAFFVGLTLLNAKFVIHGAPLLAVGLVGFYNKLKDTKKDKMKKMLLFAFTFAVLIGVSAGIPNKMPDSDFWEGLEYAQQKSIDLNKPFKNDWSFGYWIESVGHTASAKGGESPQNYYSSIVLTWEDLNQSMNCTELKKWSALKVFDCPKRPPIP